MKSSARLILVACLAPAAIVACDQPEPTPQPTGEAAETHELLVETETEPLEPLDAEGVGTPFTTVAIDELTLVFPADDSSPETDQLAVLRLEPPGTESQPEEVSRDEQRIGDRSSNDSADEPAVVVGAAVGGSVTIRGMGTGADGRQLNRHTTRDNRFSGRPAPAPRPALEDPYQGGEQFEDYGENDWTDSSVDPLATFSIDVDSASYAIARRDLNSAQLPQPAGIRVEEFINVFDYGYAGPDDLETPFALHVESAPSHFGEGLQLLRVGIQGFETDPGDRAPANLVFLIDTSGSMRGASKLGLVQYALNTLLNSLGPDDTLSIVTYSGRAETLLAPSHVDDRATIRDAIDRLSAGGSTNGADGIRTAYEIAQSVFLEGGTNRVIWCTDGDLNVGMTGDELLGFVEDHGRRGVALTTLGFGRGNLNDRDLERFADGGDGNYHYIDDRNEALRVLGDELMGTLEVIARDVKIQVEVNPRLVNSYRIIGYENRDIADADFRNDQVDAGEIGSGHSVTALLELDMNEGAVVTRNERIATVRVRYEQPDEEGEGREIEESLYSHQLGARFEDASASLRLAAGVAEFAEVLRRGENATGAEFDEVERVISGAHARGDLQVEELAALVTQARSLWR